MYYKKAVTLYYLLYIRCYQTITDTTEDNGHGCPVRGFICTKPNLLCTVCVRELPEGAVILLHPTADNSTYRGKYCCVNAACYNGVVASRKALYLSICSKCNRSIFKGSDIRPATNEEGLPVKAFIHTVCPTTPVESITQSAARKRQRLADIAADSDKETVHNESEESQESFRL